VRSLLLTNKAFRTFRWFGLHVTPVHYYSPVPDLRELEGRPQIWERASELPGIRMNDSCQLQLMEEVFARYRRECDFPSEATGCPHEYYTRNSFFGYVSACAMHGMIRHLRPSRILEIGAGHSTRVIARAVRLNEAEGSPAEVIAVDPYPAETLRAGVPGLSRVIASTVQSVDLDLLASPAANDIVSIDTSHAVRTGGDVVFLYLELLPRLKPGVFVHIHDIFLPWEYPKHWLQKRHFWNEQYLLQAFLIGNTGFEVVWGQRYAERRFPETFARAFGNRLDEGENFDSCSFWIRRTEDGAELAPGRHGVSHASA
jgi:hypothetical protein